MTQQNQFMFAAAHAIKVIDHDKHRVGDEPPPAALAARARGHWPQGCESIDTNNFTSPIA
eukprot:4941024-Pleurochrysis_carterae.AAC.4